MIKITKKVLAFILVSMMLVGLFPDTTFSAHEKPVLAMSIANKIDVALAVGSTSIDYSMFESDLRYALRHNADNSLREHPVLDEDVYVMAAQAISANTTSEFSWWEYDHTRGTTRYNSEANRKVIPTISDIDHIYVENDTSASQTGNSPGRPQDIDPNQLTSTAVGSTYTPPKEAYSDEPDILMKNPDVDVFLGSVHPYQGNYRHMIESNSGSTMDFYGYSANAYKDFRYLPNEQKTIKTFEFSIAEDLAYDALEGIGFFFNTNIAGSYEVGNQMMSGYLLFLEYTSSGVGNAIKLYKLDNINTKTFHHTTTSTLLSAFPGVTLVAHSTVYSSTHYSRRIKIEASPDSVKVWYVGNTKKNDATTLKTAINDYAMVVEPVQFTIQAGGVLMGQTNGSYTSNVKLDPDLITSYGFGPMGAYRSHTCARPTHLALQNLSMTYEKVKTLAEAVREPEWHENTIKYLVNLNEKKIEDFEESTVIAELLARLTNDDIYYIGWGSTENAISSAAFLRKHSIKGTFVDIEALTKLKVCQEWLALDSETQGSYLACIKEALNYKEQVQKIADEIYKRYWNQADNSCMLITDYVKLSVSGADMQNTADALWPDGKWMIEHLTREGTIEIDEGVYMTNFEGLYPYSGKYVSDLEASSNFPMPGLYRIYYRSVQFVELYVHRKPVASFEVTLVGDVPVFKGNSYDPDVYNPEVNGAARGISEETWEWIDLDDRDMFVSERGLPDVLIEGHSYIITLTVEDDWGATDSISRLITYSNMESDESLPPFADFTLTPTLFIKTSDATVQQTQNITLTNRSYDPAGRNITSAWTIHKDDEPYGALAIDEADFDSNIAEYVVGDLPAGRYKITLATTNDGGAESASVAKFFDIKEDMILPTAIISQAAPQTFPGNSTLTLTFSDTGGSGFKEGRFAVTQSSSVPASDSSDWKILSSSSTRSILINVVGDNHVYWEAWDNSGNYAFGAFGPYTVTKSSATISLEAVPQDGSSAVYGSPGQGITLTATLSSVSEEPTPTGEVIFYQGTTTLGSGMVNASGVAIWTGNSSAWGSPAQYYAVYQGDSNYKSAQASDSCDVKKNPYATVTIGTQIDRQYDTTGYVPVNIEVSPMITYKVEYEGRSETVYARSTAAPENAGKYTLIVTTTDPNYLEQSGYADFEILPRELALSLYVDPNIGETHGTVTLTGAISNAEGLPTGSLEFYAGDSLIDIVESKGFAGAGGDYTAQAVWNGMTSGDYILTLKYVPTSTDNYIAADYIITEYNVRKADQTISFTVPGLGPINDKAYGDETFTITASGGMTEDAITYSLVSGEGIVSIDTNTGEVTILAAGTAVIRATKPGNESYNQATMDIIINIGKKVGDMTILQDNVVFGEEIMPTVIVNESNSTVTYSYTGDGDTVYGPDSTPPKEVGDYIITAKTIETENYQSVICSVAFSITPCECDVISVYFDSATIDIPYYDVQKGYTLNAEAVLDSCKRSGHNYSFTYLYEIYNLPTPRSATINGTTGQLIVNDKAVDDTIRIKVTARHLPTGHTNVSYADFEVTKSRKPSDPDPSESGFLNKNNDVPFSIDISTIASEVGILSVTYNNGPDADQDLQGSLIQNTDYTIGNGIIEFSDEFISGLHTGEHEFTVEMNGDTLTFYLYIAPGDVIMDVVQDEEILPVSGNTGDLEISERASQTNKNDFLDKGYNIYFDLYITAAEKTAEGVAEAQLIRSRTDSKLVGAMVDITLIKTTYDNREILKEVSSPVQLTIDIPQAIRGQKNYVVVRAHTLEEGESEYVLLPTTLINNGTQLSFSSDRFSTFAILYNKSNLDIDPGNDSSGGGSSVNPDVEDNNVSDIIKIVLETENHIKYISGYEDGTVRPNNAITRAEIATIFFRLLKDPEKNSSSNDRFADVLENVWYAQSVNYLAKLGLLKGYTDGTFKPNQNITRAEFAAIASRFDNLETDITNPFTDVMINHWAYEYILSAYSKGWVKGYPNSVFKPQNSITRAEVVAIVNRMLGRRLDRAEIPKDLYTLFPDLKTSHWSFSDIVEASVTHEYNRKTDGYEIWERP